MATTTGPGEAGKRLKEVIRSHLLDNKYDVVDATEGQGVDFADATLAIAKDVQNQKGNLGIAIGTFGAGSFMVATKVKGMIAAEVSDEHSGYTIRGYNNSRMVTIGSEIVGDILAKNVVKGFAEGKYDGSGHQIRIDILDKMC